MDHDRAPGDACMLDCDNRMGTGEVCGLSSAVKGQESQEGKVERSKNQKSSFPG